MWIIFEANVGSIFNINFVLQSQGDDIFTFPVKSIHGFLLHPSPDKTAFLKRAQKFWYLQISPKTFHLS